MKKFFAIFFIFTSFALAQETKPKLEQAEAVALSKAMDMNDDAKSLGALKNFAKGKEVGAAFLYNIAILNSNLDNLDEAIKAYSLAVSKYENFYLAHKNLAFCYAKSQKYELALKHISKAAALEGLDLQMYMCLANINLNLNNYSEALFALKNAKMMSPTDDSINYNILHCLANLEQWQELKLASESILETNKRSQKAWRSLSFALLNLGQDTEAIAAIEAMKILGLAENRDLALLANCYFNKEIFEKAVPLYLEIKADVEAETLAKIANALVDVSMLDEALELAPNTDFGNLAKARVYKLRGESENAEVFVNKALSLNPLNRNALMFLAQLQIDNEDFANAKLSLNRLCGDADFAYRAKYLLSYIAIKELDYELALELLRQIRNSENFEYIDSYIKKIEKFLDA